MMLTSLSPLNLSVYNMCICHMVIILTCLRVFVIVGLYLYTTYILYVSCICVLYCIFAIRSIVWTYVWRKKMEAIDGGYGQQLWSVYWHTRIWNHRWQVSTPHTYNCSILNYNIINTMCIAHRNHFFFFYQQWLYLYNRLQNEPILAITYSLVLSKLLIKYKLLLTGSFKVWYTL